LVGGAVASSETVGVEPSVGMGVGRGVMITRGGISSGTGGGVTIGATGFGVGVGGVFGGGVGLGTEPHEYEPAQRGEGAPADREGRGGLL